MKVINISFNGSRINRVIILNVIGTISYQAINFLLTPILTRALGQYDFGIVVLYTSWVNILLPILSLNVESVVPLIPINIDKNDQPRYISSLVGLSLSNFTILASICLIFLKQVSALLQFEPIVVVMLLMQCFGTMLVHFIISYYVQYQRTVMQFVFSITIAVTTCLLTVGLLLFITDDRYKYLCRILGYALPYFLAGLVVLLVLLRTSKKWFCTDVWRYALPICVPFIFHTLSHLVLNQSGKIILQNFAQNGVENAGYYGFTYTVATVMQIIWTALNNAWVPYYYRNLANKDDDTIKRSSARYMGLYTGGFMAFTLISPEFTRIMGGDKYIGSERLVILLLFGIYLIYLYSFPVNYKTYQKRAGSIAMGTIVASLVNIVLCLILVPHLSYWGCAIAAVAAYFVLFMLHQLTVKDKSGQYKFSASFFLCGGASALLACAGSWLLVDYTMVRWLLALAVGAVVLVRIIRQKSIF